MLFTLIRGKTWTEVQRKCERLEVTSKRDRDDTIRAVAARQRAEMDLLKSMEREQALMRELVEQARLIGKMRLRFGATEEEVEQERRRKEREEALDDIETDRLSTELHDREQLEKRRQEGVEDGFQEL